MNQTAFFFSRMGKLKSTHRSVIVVIVDSRPCLKTKHQSYWNYFLVSDDSSLLSMRADTDVRLILVLRVYSACRKPQVQCLQGRDRRHRCVRRWQEVTFRSFSRFYTFCRLFVLRRKVSIPVCFSVWTPKDQPKGTSGFSVRESEENGCRPRYF